MSSVISAGTSTGSALNFTGDTSGSLALATNNGVTAVTIDTNQRVAIGNGTAIQKLNIASSTGTVGIALQPNTSTGTFAYILTDGTYGYLASSSGVSGNKFTYKLDAPDNSLVLDSSGRLGIGQATPAAMVDVYGSTGVTSGYSTGTSMPYMLRLFNSSSGVTGLTAGIQLQTRSGDSSGALWNIGAVSHSGGNYSNLVFQQQIASTFVEAGRFDITGNLLLGTTSQISTEKLSVYSGTAATTAFIKSRRDTNGDIVLALWNGQNTNNSTSYFIWGICDSVGGNGNTFSVASNGNVKNTNNSYAAISDIKLKENITDATPKLSDLMQVKVRNYNLIGETQKQIGVVAQELETVFPGLVDESTDKDREGNDLETTTKSVKYSVFVPMLIKAMQEQQEIITGMQAEIAALKAKVGA